MDTKEQIIRLVRIQELASEIYRARKTVDDAPQRIEEIESRFRERNAEYVAVKDRHDELDADQRSRNSELATLEESRKKFMQDLMQVQNQREYSAMLKEIDAVKAQIAENEDAILKDMEELETLKTDLEKHTEHIEEERKLVERELAEVNGSVEESKKLIEVSERERSFIEAELPRNLVDTIRRFEGIRGGIFLARAEDGTCQSCYVRVRPQVFQEIKLASAIHQCGSCHRFLYFPKVVEEGLNALRPAVKVADGEAV